MTTKEMSDWIEKHAYINKRLDEIYTRLGYLENIFSRVKATSADRLQTIKYYDKILFKIAKKCMEVKNPENTLKTIYEIVMNAHRDLNEDK